MGNKSSAQAGFLWLHPSPYSSSRISTSERESSGRSAAAAREPLPTWFEVNPLDQELRWQCASIDDIILEGADSKEVEDGPDALVHRPTAAPTIQGQLSLASVRSVRALAASSDSSPYVFVMEGTNGRSPWKLTLQAADAVSMLSWVSFFRRFVTVEKPLSDVASMVFHSIRIGDVAAAFEALVRLGRVPAPRDGNGNTPLLAAACIGNVSLLQQLILAATGGLRATGTLRDVNLDGWSVLHCAAGSGTSRAVKAVLAALSRVDPAARSGPISGDALLEAPRPGGSIPAAAFHDVEASVTDVLQFRCLGGMTALHVAASRGRDPVLLRLLAQAGVNCFLCDDSGRSLAHYIAATVRSQPALVEEDEWGGSAVEEPDEDSAAAALCAQWVTSAVPELLDWRDSAGNTPLHTAALHG